MPRITAVWDNVNLMRFYRRVPRLVRAHSRRRLFYWGRYLVKDIRKHSGVFKYKGGRGGRSAPLINSMWTERGKGKEIKQSIGWGVAHGEVMEFGPRTAKSWIIAPRGFRSDVTHGRSGGGVALKMLRFKWHGKITYARQVTHVWDDGQKRPHVEPALKRHERNMMHDLSTIPKRVMEGKLT